MNIFVTSYLIMYCAQRNKYITRSILPQILPVSLQRKTRILNIKRYRYNHNIIVCI